MSNSTSRLKDKVAIITGGARGQGAVEAELFTAEGAAVVLTDVLAAEGAATAERLGASFLEHDVTKAGDWSRVVAQTLARYGRIDILINNAGIYLGKRMLETDEADYDRVMGINAKGVFLGMQAVGPAMCEQGSGSIVNISSIAGMVSSTGAFVYGASKWAVRGMTKTAAVELARFGVRCNSIHPGMIETDMLTEVLDGSEQRRERMMRTIPLRKAARPDDIANMALFLASDESNYATGSEFVVDGGYTAL
jgi:3alpha(or 20beta)-hydroxysteroid dehydrogenase